MFLGSLQSATRDTNLAQARAEVTSYVDSFFLYRQGEKTWLVIYKSSSPALEFLRIHEGTKF
jgi:hypothetical protein